MKRGARISLVILLSFLFSACSITRHIPQGEYLLSKITIEDDKSVSGKERISATTLEKYVRQNLNKRLFGVNFYVWLHESANPEKQNRWNNWKRRQGEAPVLLDQSLTDKSAENMKIFMDSKGFFRSEATFEIDTLSKRRRARVTYRVRQGEPYRIDRLTYDFQDKFLEPIVLADTINSLIRTGEVFDISALDKERERITSYLKERGYFNFSVSNIEYLADTLLAPYRVGVKLVVKQNITGYNDRGQPILDNNMVYRIDRINIFPDYDAVTMRSDTTLQQRLDTLYYRGLNVIYEKRPNLRPSVLRQAVPLYPNYVYNSAQLNRAYNDLMALGYFKLTRISFIEQPQTADVTNYVSYIGEGADSTQTHYTKEGYLECNILCTPTLKQSFKAELEGSTTSSFYGLKATLGYQNRNIFRGAEALDISFSAGYEFMKAPDAKKKRATEFGVKTSLTFSRFLLPWRTSRFRTTNLPKTKIELAVNFQDRPYYRRTLTSASLAYQWTNARYSSFTLRPIDINIVDVNDLDPVFLMNTYNLYLLNSYITQLMAGLSFSYNYNNQFKNLNGNATVIRFNAETSGNLIGAFSHLFSSPHTEVDDDGTQEVYNRFLGIRYSQYVRADISLSRKIRLGEKVALVGRLYGGVGTAYGNSTSMPFDRLFYAGGSNSMRGWVPRALGPGSLEMEAIDYEYPTQLGDMKLEANLELRFPIWGAVHGATFLDVGNVWFVKNDSEEYSDDMVFYIKDFYKQLGFNTGLGIRIDIKFAVLRLDWGIQLHSPNRPVGERWIHNFLWKNTTLSFGVGYPF